MTEHEREEDHCLNSEELKRVLELSLDQENDLMRTYIITSQRIQGHDDLKLRLQNFAEGNAKRTNQLMMELGNLSTEQMPQE